MNYQPRGIDQAIQGPASYLSELGAAEALLKTKPTWDGVTAEAVARMRLFAPADIAVFFGNNRLAPTPIGYQEMNRYGAVQTSCTYCGECDVGCNFGAKNTLDYNYLTHAKHHGAEIRTLADVRTIAPRAGGGYAVIWAGRPDRATAARTSSRAANCSEVLVSRETATVTPSVWARRPCFSLERVLIVPAFDRQVDRH